MQPLVFGGVQFRKPNASLASRVASQNKRVVHQAKTSDQQRKPPNSTMLFGLMYYAQSMMVKKNHKCDSLI